MFISWRFVYLIFGDFNPVIDYAKFIYISSLGALAVYLALLKAIKHGFVSHHSSNIEAHGEK